MDLEQEYSNLNSLLWNIVEQTKAKSIPKELYTQRRYEWRKSHTKNGQPTDYASYVAKTTPKTDWENVSKVIADDKVCLFI